MALTYPLRIPAVKASQPLGDFYIAAIPVRALLDTAYSDRLKAIRSGKSYALEGAQRALREVRLKQIGAHIDTEESAFPNSIILAANYREADGFIEENEALRWRVEADPRGGACLSLVIPSDIKLAPIIDGQHRLFGYRFAEKVERLDDELVCSIFLDLPKPFQAFLFATINSTQKPVDKSLTYELFGYNVDSEVAEAWSPEKLAVFLARKLNSEKASPLKGRILVTAENDFALTRAEAKRQQIWVVSMATVVEGIAKLVSQNPKRDATLLLQQPVSSRDRSVLAKVAVADKSPMRNLYLEARDKVIYAAVFNFLSACDQVLWAHARPESFITKTVGLQALFDVLRTLAHEAVASKDMSKDFFNNRLASVARVDFADMFFQNASGSGRSVIRNCIELLLELKAPGDLNPNDRAEYLRVSGL